uniref:Ribonuclease A-domain domain-containing protein n=1 Tax=Labrus bergylta TaxID=56723 RepID=A0A3Q3EUR1_9LABR
MRIQFALLLLLSFALLLLLSATVLCIPMTLQEKYKKFIKQHVKSKMNAGRCDTVIKRRKIKTMDNLCKETNTFIRSNNSQINAVCENAGEPYGDMTIKLKYKRARRPRCQYRGRRDNRRIVIRCEEGYPVHYHNRVLLRTKR